MSTYTPCPKTETEPMATVHSSPLAAQSLPPVHINSSWIGNQWIPPPGYQLFSTREIQTYFRRHSVLFVGDSTARQSYATLFGILNNTEHPKDVPTNDINHPAIININKGIVTETPCSKEGVSLCRKMPLNASNQFDYADKLDCLIELVNYAKDESSPLWSNWVNEYTLIIFVLGPHEVMHTKQCQTKRARKYGRKNQTDILFQNLFQADDNLKGGSKNTTFLWRTWGSPGTKSPKDDAQMWNRARAHNNYVKMLVEKQDISRKNAGKEMGRVSYIDWGQAMLPRLYPLNVRIRGDIYPHYGLEARLAFVQMLMNHVVERDRQKELKIHPSLSMDHVNNHGDEDPEHFMTTSKAKNETETKLLEMTRASFCDECIWSSQTICRMRLSYLIYKYGEKNSKLELMIVLMRDSPTCNSTLP